jgi:hypothetical protein
MSRLLKWIGIFAIPVLIVMQFMTPNKVNRKVDPSQTIEAVTQMTQPFPDVAAILERSCKDCHSEKTVWRWYSNIAPVSWLQMADVGMARDLMNFSRWSDYTRAQQEDRLKGMCEEVRSGDMPLWYYKPLHPSGWLSSGDVNRLCEWTDAERKRLAQSPPNP